MNIVHEAISDLAQAAGVISNPVDATEDLVLGELYYVELLREVQKRITDIKDAIKCPKHTTGGGPCYCHAPKQRRYTFTTADGGKVSTNDETMSGAIRKALDRQPDINIVSAKSEVI